MGPIRFYGHFSAKGWQHINQAFAEIDKIIREILVNEAGITYFCYCGNRMPVIIRFSAKRNEI